MRSVVIAARPIGHGLWAPVYPVRYARTIWNLFLFTSVTEQPIGIVVTLEACLKLHLTNQALISVGAKRLISSREWS